MTAPNDCTFSPLLGPFHDGELPADRHDAVAAHLRTCQPCAAELAEIRRFAAVFRAADRPAAPPPERWESAVLAAAREQGLVRDGEDVAADAPRPAMRLAGGPADAAWPARATARPAEPRHLRFVRRLTAVAAAVFLVAAGRVAYERYQRPSDPGVPMPGNQTGLPGTEPAGQDDRGGKGAPSPAGAPARQGLSEPGQTPQG